MLGRRHGSRRHRSETQWHNNQSVVTHRSYARLTIEKRQQLSSDSQMYLGSFSFSYKKSIQFSVFCVSGLYLKFGSGPHYYMAKIFMRLGGFEPGL